MQSVIEINKPLMAALRRSEVLPNTHDQGNGKLRILFSEDNHPVGYLLEKVAREDAWESLEPRYFITTSHTEALRLMAVPCRELPVRELAAT